MTDAAYRALESAWWRISNRRDREVMWRKAEYGDEWTNRMQSLTDAYHIALISYMDSRYD